MVGRASARCTCTCSPRRSPALPSGAYTTEVEIVIAGVRQVIDRAMAARYGGLLDNPACDRRLINRLHRNYRNVWP